MFFCFETNIGFNGIFYPPNVSLHLTGTCNTLGCISAPQSWPSSPGLSSCGAGKFNLEILYPQHHHNDLLFMILNNLQFV